MLLCRAGKRGEAADEDARRASLDAVGHRTPRLRPELHHHRDLRGAVCDVRLRRHVHAHVAPQPSFSRRSDRPLLDRRHHLRTNRRQRPRRHLLGHFGDPPPARARSAPQVHRLPPQNGQSRQLPRLLLDLLVPRHRGGRSQRVPGLVHLLRPPPQPWPWLAWRPLAAHGRFSRRHQLLRLARLPHLPPCRQARAPPRRRA
mmetsp:Transcript_49266/g.116075  ORF Transcript_49266/g.116075 Transcript_49266/m.116075 type:complete len:201 (-) Transcript_49266:527-1129(-)